MSKQYWNTKQLHIELEPSQQTIALLVVIHLAALAALGYSKAPLSVSIFVVGILVFSFYLALHRFGLLLFRSSLLVLDFSQQHWRQKLADDTDYQPVDVTGRLFFGAILLHVRDPQKFGGNFTLLTEGHLGRERFRLLRGLLVSL